jgi:hypothetical protein
MLIKNNLIDALRGKLFHIHWLQVQGSRLKRKHT